MSESVAFLRSAWAHRTALDSPSTDRDNDARFTLGGYQGLGNDPEHVTCHILGTNNIPVCNDNVPPC